MIEPSSRGKVSLHRWASLRNELLWVHDGPVVAPTEHQLADHSMGYWMWLMREGEVQVQGGGTTLTAGKDQWIVTPQCKIKQDFTKHSRILSLHFHCQWPSGENFFSGTDGYVFNAGDQPALAETAATLASLAKQHFPREKTDFPFQTAEYRVFLAFQKAFMQLLIDFSDIFFAKGRHPARTGEVSERLTEALECLNEAPLDEAFPATLLRRKTGLGRAYLDRLFLREFNITTKGHWGRLRLDAATRSLHNSSLSIKEIGYKVGFKQTANFTKWFIKCTGMTPTEYRANGTRHWLL